MDQTSTQALACDVLVLGSGLSGVALAARLSLAGWRVVLAGPQPTSTGPALHWLTRASQARLARLHCPAGPIEEAPEFLAAWGTDGGLPLADHSANDRLIIDAARLRHEMRGVARNAGVHLLAAGATRILQRDVSWRVQLERAGGWTNVQARFLVDATGRAAVAAHMLGASRVVHDGLAAWRWLLERPHDEPRQMMLIESAPHGWWRAIDHSDGRREITLFSDADLQAEQAVDWDSVLALALHAPATVQRMIDCAAPAAVDGYVAGCSSLSEVAGRGWLAVGDAAATFDPIGIGGIDFALICADIACGVIAEALTQTPDAALRFSALVHSARAAQALERQARYDAETRWPHAPFWQRRRVAPPVDRDAEVQDSATALWTGLAVAA